MDKTKFTLGKFSFPIFLEPTVPRTTIKLFSFLYFVYTGRLRKMNGRIFLLNKKIILLCKMFLSQRKKGTWYRGRIFLLILSTFIIYVTIDTLC
jgi:hypothetical protein